MLELQGAEMSDSTAQAHGHLANFEENAKRQREKLQIITSRLQLVQDKIFGPEPQEVAGATMAEGSKAMTQRVYQAQHEAEAFIDIISGITDTLEEL